MGDRLQEIRTVWNREDTTQTITLGKAFDAIEWCLGEIGRLSTQLGAMTRLKESFEDQVARLARERDGLVREPIRDMFDEASDRADKAEAERNAALKREGRLRGALEKVRDLADCAESAAHREAVKVANKALADEGRE